MFGQKDPYQANADLPGDPGSGEDPGAGQISYVKEAFHWQYNLIGLGGLAAFALLSASALPLVLGAGLELIYLSTIPRNSRFQRLVRSWKYAAEKSRRETKLQALLQELPPPLRARYNALNEKCLAIRANYRRLSSTSQMLAAQMEGRLQGLMQAYLRLLGTAHQHHDYLRSTDPDAIKREAAQLQRTQQSDSPQVQEINRKRIEILNKRLEKFQKIRENCDVIDAQCAAIEDVLELTRDQSVTMRDPQQVSDQLDSLVRDVEQTEQTVQQVEAIFATSGLEMADSGAPQQAVSPQSGSRPTTRTRVRN